VPRQVARAFDTLRTAIDSADPRNNPADGFLMLNTYSSWCMYPVIKKQIAAAQRMTNAAKNAVKAARKTGVGAGAAVPSGIAKDALHAALAATLACDSQDHWRCDTESPEECEEVAKRVTMLWRSVLWFTDADLGVTDPYTRTALLWKLKDMDRDWDCCGEPLGNGIKVLTNNNRQGRGRDPNASPRPAKKPRLKLADVSESSSSAAGGGAAGGGGAVSSLNGFLNTLAVSGGLKRRVKTYLQLKVAQVGHPSRCCTVVVSGATSMKKIAHLVAFCTGHAADFHYHSQKGANLKDAWLVVQTADGSSRTWLGGAALKRKAAGAGAGFALDKNVKIVQVFQGLNTTRTGGIVWDSELAESIVVHFVVGTHRYAITVDCIYAQKCVMGKAYPLPRLVVHGGISTTWQTATGFGQRIHSANDTMRGDRQVPPQIYFGHVSQAEINAQSRKFQAQPLIDADGASNMHDPMGIVEDYMWSSANVASAQ
jgi:hypothetical protein